MTAAIFFLGGLAAPTIGCVFAFRGSLLAIGVPARAGRRLNAPYLNDFYD